jgi:hypothetical protein
MLQVFCPVAAACAGEPKLFLLEKAASKNDFIGTIFIILKIQGRRPPVQSAFKWFASLSRSFAAAACICSQTSLNVYRIFELG